MKKTLSYLLSVLLIGFNAQAAKKTYMDCQTSSPTLKRVVLKAQKKNEQLSQFEVILVDEKGKSSVFMSKDSLDQRYIDPSTVKTKHINIVGSSSDTKREDGMVENATAVSLFQAEDAQAEDMSCLSLQHRAGEAAVEDNAPIKNKQLVKEIKYNKFSGTLHHKNQLVELTCVSPMMPREDHCGLNTDSRVSSEEMPSSL